jgi:molybdate transport system permease protein
MDWQALWLSIELAAVTLAVLLPLGLALGRWLATTNWAGRAWIEALVMLPLVLPPTVLGFYLLMSLGQGSPVGRWLSEHLGLQITFNFAGLVLASIVFNIPFIVQPIQRAFEAIPRDLGEAAAVSGLGFWAQLRRIELPLAWPGILSAMVLTFVHTLGEFGVVLMMGGNIPGETKTIAIAIYDRTQAFDLDGANRMAFFLVALSFAAVAASFFASARLVRRR